MLKTAAEIADAVLEKVGYEPDVPPGLPALLGAGAGIGTGAGALFGGMQSAPEIVRAIQLKGQIPGQEAIRGQLDELLKGVRGRAPVLEKLTDRALVKRLLQAGQAPEMHYALRRGYEEGLAGLSRSTKTLEALKRKILRNILKKSLLGTGAGIGGGLLAATALGHFD